MDDSDLAILRVQVQSVMEMSVTQLEAVINDKKIGLSSDYPHRYISTLQDDNLALALKAIIIGYLITDGREISRELQVDAVRMSYEKDSAVFAGTGSGKTLIIAILIWMTGDRKVCFTVSPLKRLQSTQAKDFRLKYKIPKLAINGETDRTVKFWLARAGFVNGLGSSVDESTSMGGEIGGSTTSVSGSVDSGAQKMEGNG
ncbi:hypothetical protein VNI00_005142 [Paramarasmius palmivorus]|uniref:DEAD/DEAH-box helicase domain-containing protein n=1 Tax=Paramarasmius palmivorus TaxID=297713 RepID=A0AAW0DH67_9AGAR